MVRVSVTIRVSVRISVGEYRRVIFIFNLKAIHKPLFFGS